MACFTASGNRWHVSLPAVAAGSEMHHCQQWESSSWPVVITVIAHCFLDKLNDTTPHKLVVFTLLNSSHFFFFPSKFWESCGTLNYNLTFWTIVTHCIDCISSKRPLRCSCRCIGIVVVSNFGAEIQLVTKFSKRSKSVEVLTLIYLSVCILTQTEGVGESHVDWPMFPFVDILIWAPVYRHRYTVSTIRPLL